MHAYSVLLSLKERIRKPEVQLSQRDRAMIRVIEYFVTQGQLRSFAISLKKGAKSLLVGYFVVTICLSRAVSDVFSVK